MIGGAELRALRLQLFFSASQPRRWANQKNSAPVYINHEFENMKRNPIIRVWTLTVLLLVCLVTGTQAQTIGTSIATVADNGTSGMFFATVGPEVDVAVNMDDAEAFSIYVESGKAYFCKLRIRGGRFIVKPGDCVVIKTAEQKTIALEGPDDDDKSSVRYTDLICLPEDMPTAEFIANNLVAEGEYIYMLTNMESNGGFGFTHFTGDTMRKGCFYIVSTIEPQTTAISATTRAKDFSFSYIDNSIYDQRGQKVAIPRAGQIYIQGGRKFVATTTGVIGHSENQPHASTRAAKDLEDGDPVPFLHGEDGNDDGFVTGTKPLTRGDVNGDGEVNATDVELISDNILGKPTTTFLKKAADINEDKVINVIDIVGTVNMIK